MTTRLPIPGGVHGKAAEKAYMGTVQETLKIMGWAYVHVYALTDSRGTWRTPTSGPLAKGWVDLLCFRREWVIGIELKGYTADGRPTAFQPGQTECLDTIARIPTGRAWVLRPTDDWDQTVAWLRHPDRAPRTFGYTTTLVESAEQPR